jgi:hypothetical protein
MGFRQDSAPITDLLPKLLKRAVLGVPTHYTARTFVARIGHHLLIYATLAASAILLVIFLYRPLETGIILAVLVSLCALASNWPRPGNSSSNTAAAAYARVLPMGVPVLLYILAASLLWKELTDGALSRLFGG